MCRNLNSPSAPPRTDSPRRRLYYVRAFRARLLALLSCVFLICAQGSGIFAPNALFAAEDWAAFLDALKARGYDDVALVYLKQLQASEAAPPELNDELDYKIAAAAFDAWTAAPAANRDALAEQARDAFAKYLKSAPEGDYALEANVGLARLAADRGDRALDAANKKGIAPDEADSKRLAARDAYSEAKPYLSAALKIAQARAKSLQESGDSNVRELQKAQGAFLDALVRSATLQAQTARCFSPDSQDYKSGLEKAAAEFNRIYTAYGQYVGAFKARFLEAECRHDLGDDDETLKILEELAVLPFEEQFYALKTRALALYAEIADKKDDPTANMSLVKKYNDWKDGEKLPAQYYASAEGLRIQLLAGRAIVRLERLRRTDYDAYARAGKRVFVDAADPTYRIMNVPAKRGASGNTVVILALKTLGELAAGRGPTALEAQNLLKDEIFEGIDASKYSFARKAEDFQSAADAATRAAAAFSQARSDYANAAPDAAADAKRAMQEAGSDAIRAFRTAFDWGARAVRPDRKGKIRDEEIQAAQEEIDKLYMKYAVVCFSLERYEDAFVAGEYLARRRPDFADSPQGAIVALRSLQSTLAALRAQDASESAIADVQKRLGAFSDYVAERWSDGSGESAIAQEAALIKLDAAVANGDVAGAKAFLEQIPPTSSRRATAELRLGKALWTEWNARNAEFNSAREDADDADAQALADAKAKLDELSEAARESLENGLERMLQSPSGVTEKDYAAIFSTYLLAQIYERQGKLDDAEKWLTHPVIGALSAVERVMEPGDAAAEQEDAQEVLNESFRMAVLALALSVQTADPNRFDEAEKTIARLEAVSGDSEAAGKKLTGVYLRLGKRLEERMSELKEAAEDGDESKQAELDAVAKGFEAFLNRASSREAGNSYASMRWVADSYLSLGRGLTGAASDPPRAALEYFAKAGKTYQTILKRIDAEADFAPNETAKLSVELKVVECLRSMGSYQKAFEQLKKSLREARDNVDVQREAAQIFQDWGRKDSKYYLTAIVGASPDEKGSNQIWGWNGLIRRLGPAVDKGERFKELFYEAYLAKTRCRFLYARKLKDKDARAKQARDAEEDLKRLYQTRPDLGGPATFRKFNSAYMNFQKMRGEKTVRGLRESVDAPVK